MWSYATRVFGAVLVTAALVACSEDEADEAASAASLPSVVVSPVTQQDVSGRLEYVGRTVAYKQVEVFARIRGFLTARSFDEGAAVEAGAILFVIDPAEFQAAVSAAEANVRRAEAAHDFALKELERARTLVKRGNLSQATLDERVSSAARGKAEVDAAKAALTRAELDLGYTEIKTPISGRIGRAAFDVGSLVGPDSGSLATIVALNPIYVTFAVSERDVLDYQQASARGEAEDYVPTLRLANGTEFDRAGTTDFIDNKVDPLTGTVLLRAVFSNSDELLRPGQFVTVVNKTAQTRRKVVIPQAAVQENQSGRFVLVVDATDTVAVRPVIMGQRTGREWVVEEGLEPGESIIVEGIQKVRPGAKVHPVAIAGQR